MEMTTQEGLNLSGMTPEAMGHARLEQAVKQWGMITRAATMFDRLLLYGPPGTGKSTFAGHSMRARFGEAKTFFQTLTPEMTYATLTAHWMIGEEGKYELHRGSAVNAWAVGGGLLLDEVDKASGDVFACLQTFLDHNDVAAFTLPNGETIRPQEGYTAIGTMNGTPGCLPEAIRDRLTIQLRINTPNPEAVAKLPADLQCLALSAVGHEDPGKRISLRDWFKFAQGRTKLDQAGVTLEELGEMVFDTKWQPLHDTLVLAQ